ncbi:MAG: hypothetical protein ACKPKO_32550, partial [Candidatus Fonsibacter sp.]
VAAVGKVPTAQVVAGVTEIDDDDDMPAVQIDVTGETPTEEPKQYKLIPSEWRKEYGSRATSFCGLLAF